MSHGQPIIEVGGHKAFGLPKRLLSKCMVAREAFLLLKRSCVIVENTQFDYQNAEFQILALSVPPASFFTPKFYQKLLAAGLLPGPDEGVS